MVANIPPGRMALLSELSGIPIETLQVEATKAIRDSMTAVEMVDFGFDIDRADISETPDGRGYGVIPTTVIAKVKGQGVFRIMQPTIGFEDEGPWHLVRIDQPARAKMLSDAYPRFVGVAFPTGSVEVLE